MWSALILLPLLLIVVLNLPLGFLRRLAFPLAVVFVVWEACLAIWHPFPDGTCGIFRCSADNLSRLMLLAISLVSFAALSMGQALLVDRRKRFNFVNLMLLMLIGLNGMVLVVDLFTLYIFLEIVSVCSFILIAFERDQAGLEGSFKYIVMSATATVMMLCAIALFLIIAGGTSFAMVSQALMYSRNGGTSLALLAIGLFVAGMFIKSGLMPFHGWVPDAYMAAPAPVSVLLAGIVTKTSGVYVLVRLATSICGMGAGARHLLFPFGPALGELFMLVGTISVVAGALAALVQHDFKRMLAYSSISQVGYIVLSLGTGTSLGLAGAVFHLFNHAMFKSLLFVNAAAVEKQTGTRDMGTLGGLAQRMPLTGFSSVVALLSTSGVPPLAGFWSKLIIIMALWQSGHVWYALTAVLASIVTLAYFLSMQRRVFFGKLRAGLENVRETGWGLALPALIFTVITIGAGVLIPFLMGTIIVPVKSLM